MEAITKKQETTTTNCRVSSTSVTMRDVDGLEHAQVPYYRMLPAMWLLATWGLMKTAITIVLVTLPSAILKEKSWQEIVHSCLIRWANGPSGVASYWFDGSSKTLAAIRAGATGFQALDIIYNRRYFDKPGVWGHQLAVWWIGMMNAQAVRNRLRITIELLVREIWRLAETGENIKILSIASGSAQAVIEAVNRAQEALRASGVTLEARLLDLDPEALAYARRLATEYRIDELEGVTFVYCEAEAGEFVKEACDNGVWEPNIVEMVGFLDYRPTDKAIALVAKIRRQISSSGLFLTCHIAPNPEAYVLRWLIKWPMLYRTPSEIEQIVRDGGFDHTEVVIEPHKIHTIVVAREE